jgi:hypothetical protein
LFVGVLDVRRRCGLPKDPQAIRSRGGMRTSESRKHPPECESRSWIIKASSDGLPCVVHDRGEDNGAIVNHSPVHSPCFSEEAARDQQEFKIHEVPYEKWREKTYNDSVWFTVTGAGVTKTVLDCVVTTVMFCVVTDAGGVTYIVLFCV